MISFAAKEDLNDLKHIWKECFHDEEQYIDFFFFNHRIEEETLVYRQDGHAVAMLNLLPAHIFIRNKRVPVRYVYAVATLPKHQGKGIAGNLLRKANEFLNKEGIATILVPANQELFHYYERKGYRTAFYLKEFHYRLSDEDSKVMAASIHEQDSADKLCLSEITPVEYKKIRDQRFMSDGFVEWGLHEIKYAMKENALLGGETKKLCVNNQEEILMYYVNQGTLMVKETTLSKDKLESTLCEIAAQLNCKGFSVRTSISNVKEGNLRPFGMILGLPEGVSLEREKLFTKDYLNLVLD